MKITEIVYAVFYYMCNICFYLNTAVNWGYWGWDRNKQDFKIFFSCNQNLQLRIKMI